MGCVQGSGVELMRLRLKTALMRSPRKVFLRRPCWRIAFEIFFGWKQANLAFRFRSTSENRRREETYDGRNYGFVAIRGVEHRMVKRAIRPVDMKIILDKRGALTVDDVH